MFEIFLLLYGVRAQNKMVFAGIEWVALTKQLVIFSTNIFYSLSSLLCLLFWIRKKVEVCDTFMHILFYGLGCVYKNKTNMDLSARNCCFMWKFVFVFSIRNYFLYEKSYFHSLELMHFDRYTKRCIQGNYSQ